MFSLHTTALRCRTMHAAHHRMPHRAAHLACLPLALSALTSGALASALHGDLRGKPRLPRISACRALLICAYDTLCRAASLTFRRCIGVYYVTLFSISLDIYAHLCASRIFRSYVSLAKDVTA